MFMYPMGEDPSNPITAYKSAEVIVDVDSQDYEENETILTNNLYARITKQWIAAQELAGLTVYTSGTSLLFLIFRSVDWFPAAIFLFGSVFLSVTLTFVFTWNCLKILDKIRLFGIGIATGFSTVISGSDILIYWLVKYQLLVGIFLVSFLILVGYAGIKFSNIYFLRKKRGY